MSEFATRDSRFWRTQLPVDFLDDSLTINDWSTVSADLSGGEPVNLWYIQLEQTNNGGTPETLELEINMVNPSTGVVTAYTFTLACNSGTIYYAIINRNLTGGDFTCILSATAYSVNASPSANVALPFFTASVGLIRVRQTTDVDVVAAQIEVNITWEKLE